MAIIDTRADVAHTAPRPGDVPHSLADISQAQSVLGYSPKVDFTTGLSRTVEWFSTDS